MSWIRESSLNFIQNLALQIVKQGSVPNHIAFIMDGNRRYAKNNMIEKIEGHSKGFDKLAETLKWCLELGVKEVTVYAFSIENFKRSKEEVDNLMELATEKFKSLNAELEKINKEGVKIRVIGNLKLLPLELQKLIAEAMLSTKYNERAKLNIAFSYTARDEMTASVKSILAGIENGEIQEEDISVDLVDKCLYTQDSLPPDLLIRTSGEVRFSDFMLWQISCSCVYFSNVLWPEFTIWELLKAVFFFQRSKDKLETLNTEKVNNSRAKQFISHLYRQRLNELEAVLS